jgi:hypothetical protein
MSQAVRGICAALLGVVALSSCTPAAITADSPRTVHAHPLSPYALLEECVAPRPGDRIEYAFESTEPIDFSIRFQDGNAVVMPVVREKSRADAGVYAPPVAQQYCLAWEAGAGGAIDYRVRLRRAGP